MSDAARADDPVHVGVRELRASLTHYLQQARQGRSIVVTSHETVIAQIGPPPQPKAVPRQPGALRGMIEMSDDFDELPEDILAAMEG